MYVHIKNNIKKKIISKKYQMTYQLHHQLLDSEFYQNCSQFVLGRLYAIIFRICCQNMNF